VYVDDSKSTIAQNALGTKNKVRQTTRFVSRIHRLLAATCANHFHDLALFRIDDTYRTEECDKCN